MLPPPRPPETGNTTSPSSPRSPIPKAKKLVRQSLDLRGSAGCTRRPRRIRAPRMRRNEGLSWRSMSARSQIVSDIGTRVSTNQRLSGTIVAMAKTPEQWLKEAAPQEKSGGIFKLFLGYAPGVGKTYNMLSEAIRRKNRGEDVVIGVVETHGRKGTTEQADQLEKVPRKKIEYKGTVFEEMDVDAILARRPQVVLADEFAHTNVEGSKHRKRYEDVLELLDNKIDVLATMNIQHLESMNPTIQ